VAVKRGQIKKATSRRSELAALPGAGEAISGLNKRPFPSITSNHIACVSEIKCHLSIFFNFDARQQLAMRKRMK
jgi:hypothetical protein